MLNSTGFHWGFRSSRSRARARGPARGLGGPAAPAAGSRAPEPPDTSPCLRDPDKSSSKTTVTTVRVEGNPKRTKTIITLRPRQPSPVKHADAHKPPAPLSRESSDSAARFHQPASPLNAPARSRALPPCATPESPGPMRESPSPVPESPASTLLSIHRIETNPKLPRYDLYDGSAFSESLRSADTTLTQIDDGLSDWGLPKVLDPSDRNEYGRADFDEEQSCFNGDNDFLADFAGELLPFEVPCVLQPSAIAYYEGVQDQDRAASAGSPRSRTPEQLRVQQFLTLMYTARLLQKHGACLPRLAQHEVRKMIIPAPEQKRSSFFGFAPLASWI